MRTASSLDPRSAPRSARRKSNPSIDSCRARDDTSSPMRSPPDGGPEVRSFDELRIVPSHVEGRLKPDATTVVIAALIAAAVLSAAQQQPLVWAADPEGGAPFVEADPA